jgi:hypothetical protein
MAAAASRKPIDARAAPFRFFAPRERGGMHLRKDFVVIESQFGRLF